MAIFGSEQAKVLLPREIADGMVKSTISTSTVAKLSRREPMKFGKVDIITFNERPKAEFVEEGAQKAPTSAGFGSVTAVPHKAQVTLRFNEEVLWAEEDHQLSVLQTVGDAGGEALSRALDFGVYHRINPLSGATIDTWTNYIGATTKRVESGVGTADIDDDFRTAVGLVINDPASGATVNGAAMDPKFSWALANLKEKDGTGTTSRMRYPQLGFGTEITEFAGVPVSLGTTVSGLPEAADTKVRAIVGDFQNGIRWGVQREQWVELIKFGDPDGQGDLKRKNEIALRLEIVFGWYVFSGRFAVVEDKR